MHQLPRGGMVQAALFGIPVFIALLLVFHPLWISLEPSSLLRGSVSVGIAGILGILAAIALIGFPQKYYGLFITYFTTATGLSAAMLLSSLRGGLSYAELTGFGMESWTTIAFVAALITGIAAIIFVLRNQSVFPLIRAISYSSALVGVLFLSDAFFSHGLAMLFGDWFSSMLLIALGLILASGLILFSGGTWRLSDGVVFGILTCALLSSGDRMLILTTAAALCLVLVLARPYKDWVGLLMWALAVLCIAVGIFVPTFLTSEKVLSGTYTELRPSGRVTQHVIWNQFADDTQSFTLGSDSSSFVGVFAQYRPEEVNATQFWNTDFPAGSSIILTQVALHGAIVIFIMSAIWISVCAQAFLDCRRSLVARPELSCLLVGSLFSGYCLLLHVPNTPFLIVSILLLASLWTLAVRTKEWSLLTKWPRLTTALFRVIVVFLFAISVSLLIAAAFRVSALTPYGRAVIDLKTEEGQTRGIRGLFASVKVEPIPVILRLQAQIALGSLRRDIENSSVVTDVMRADMKARITEAVDFAERAHAYDMQNFRSALTLSEALYIQSLLTSGTFERALLFANNATILASRHPLPPFLAAQILYAQGDRPTALKKLNRTLELKPNFDEARSLLNRLEAE